MTNNPEFPPSTPRLIAFLAYPRVGLLDLTGAQTVFWAATRYQQARSLPGYEIVNASLDGGLMHSAEGLAVDTRPLSELLVQRIDTLIVPGSPHIDEVVAVSAELIGWIGEHAKQVRRTASVCSGTFLLASAGLLDGKRAATHWAMCENLGARFPKIQVDNDAIFVAQENIWTSAGVSAGIDMALALVEADCGREVAMLVAREMVVFLKRSGGQAQFSQLLQAQAHDVAVFDELHQWLADNLARANLGVEVLAEHCHMSPRHFARLYKQKTGRSPAKAVEVFRLEAARRLLEDSHHNIDQIARQCGFGDEERMRATFQRHLAVSPRDYRRNFSR